LAAAFCYVDNSLVQDSQMHKHLQRLDRVWIEFPVYFITACTFRRRPILARDATAGVRVDELRQARERHGWAIGSYVIMPDHVHFFCAPERDAKRLSDFMREWKSWTSRRIRTVLPRPATAATKASAETSLWQREFFDHVLRSQESYAEKWDYVRDNPVRAGLVTSSDHWPYFGRIESLEEWP
jgi:REP element-mobilizing transposase RayT